VKNTIVYKNHQNQIKTSTKQPFLAIEYKQIRKKKQFLANPDEKIKMGMQKMRSYLVGYRG
jgi:hypothetical protein